MVTSYLLQKEDRQEERLEEGGIESIFMRKSVSSQRGRKLQLRFCAPDRIIQMKGLHNEILSYKERNTAEPSRNISIYLFSPVRDRGSPECHLSTLLEI